MNIRHTLSILYCHGNRTLFSEKSYFISEFTSGNTVMPNDPSLYGMFMRLFKKKRLGLDILNYMTILNCMSITAASTESGTCSFLI